jgi:hypothetical protein
MKKITSFLKHSIPSDPHLWIALALAPVFIAMEILKMFDRLGEQVALTVGLIIIMICIITLVTDRLKDSGQVQKNAAMLCSIKNSVSELTRVTLRKCPSKNEEYSYLWGGYTGTYCVYNPSYRLDQELDRNQTVKIFIKRYQNPDFEKARYLFLTKDAPGKNNLKDFRWLMAQVKQKYPGVVNKIEAKEFKDKNASLAAEMYLGRRYGEPMVVLEMQESALDPQHGMPYYYLVIQDEDAFEHYRKYQFDLAWNDTNAEVIDPFAEL